MSIKPSTSKGTRDFSSEEIIKRNYIKDKLQKAFECYGFSPIETPTFERLDTLTGVYGEEGDRLVFKILNSGDKIKKANIDALSNGEDKKFIYSISEKALRYDLTVPFARYVAQHQNNLIFPFRRYQIQPVWRADRPQHGRFQEFYQCDADIVGDKSLWQELEVLSLYNKAFMDLKIEGVTMKVNHRKILAGIVSFLGAKSRLYDFTVILDKLDKIGKDGVFKELKHNNFSTESIKKLKDILDIKGTLLQKIDKLKKLLSSQNEGLTGLNELEFIFDNIQSKKDSHSNLELDLTLARGLHYYTGMIVEIEPPSGTKIGSIGGGGRYDDLTGKFGLKNMSGIGISFGFERIYLLLEELNLFPDTLKTKTKVLFTNFGNEATQVSYKFVNQLRELNISCEIYPTEAKLKKQLGYANSKKIKNVVLIGSEELKQQKFILKNMESGSQETYPLSELISILS